MDATWVHFAVASRDGTVSPLCGTWSRATNWTTLPGAVTCPECLERLRERSGDRDPASAPTAPAAP